MATDCNISPKPKSFGAFLKSRNFLRPFLGIVLGGLGGFLYFYFAGCSSGSCALTGTPFGSIMTGSFFGFFITNSPCTRCN